MGDDDFTIAIRGVARPAGSLDFDTAGHRVVFDVVDKFVTVEVVVTRTTVTITGLLGIGGNQADGTVVITIHTIGHKAIALQVINGVEALHVHREFGVSVRVGGSGLSGSKLHHGHLLVTLESFLGGGG